MPTTSLTQQNSTKVCTTYGLNWLLVKTFSCLIRIHSKSTVDFVGFRLQFEKSPDYRAIFLFTSLTSLINFGSSYSIRSPAQSLSFRTTIVRINQNIQNIPATMAQTIFVMAMLRLTLTSMGCPSVAVHSLNRA